ncbi:MAG: TVP38/TMEM64 family protein [Cyanobacteria bacterium RI_101]|nr:TVP38/TMEM64 family protein [Cyanobacteria bacterium RI_101]
MKRSRRSKLSQSLGIGFFLVNLGAGVVVMEPGLLNLQDLLRQALEQVEHFGAWGGMAFIALYILATLAFFPGAPLTLGAGVLFGAVWGSVYVFIGATLGALGAFGVGRYWTRRWVLKQISGHPRFEAIDRAVGREGLKIVFLTRLSPLFPFNLLNYAYGVTGVSLRDYALGSLGMLPGTILYVYLGSLAGNLAALGAAPSAENAPLQWTLRLVGLGATLAATLYGAKIARSALDQSLRDAPE